MQLAPSAFLASAAASSDLVPLALQDSPIPNVVDAEAYCNWSGGLSDAPPEGVARCSQKVYNYTFKTSATAESLLLDV